MIFQPVTSPLKGEITVPGDKSISHRSVMFGALANGDTRIRGFLNGADCLSTIACFRKMGISIELKNDGANMSAGISGVSKNDGSNKMAGISGDSKNDGSNKMAGISVNYTHSIHAATSDVPSYDVIVHGRGLRGLRMPDGRLDVGNSGTTMRLISGILAGQPFASELTGDASIQKRPMKRVIDPLTSMGAKITSIPGNGCAPLSITPSKLHGIHYQSPVASAQVKSCVLLAGLYADGETAVTEPVLSRDHTERMLSAFGAALRPGTQEDPTCYVQPGNELYGQDILVPGDISSAAYFIAAGLLVPGSEVLVRNVGINPTRDGILRACKEMGGNITLLNERLCSGEPVADLLVKASSLHGVCVGGPIIPTMIDELPVVAVLAAFADGETVIKDAAELRVKESDRIAVMTENLKAMGVDIVPTDVGMIIHGGNQVHGAEVKSHMDHRIAMSLAVAALAANSETTIDHFECVDISYPDFYRDLSSLY